MSDQCDNCEHKEECDISDNIRHQILKLAHGQKLDDVLATLVSALDLIHESAPSAPRVTYYVTTKALANTMAERMDKTELTIADKILEIDGMKETTFQSSEPCGSTEVVTGPNVGPNCSSEEKH